MNTFGHNEHIVRLGMLADTAQRALERVASGETDTIEGWLAYGAALNEGRGLFPGDREFGEWLRSSKLEEGVHQADQSAAMWAAANQDDFDMARAAGNARTVRGIHEKWKQLDAERKATEERERAKVARERAEAERKVADEARRKAEVERREVASRAAAEAESKAAIKRAQDDAARKIAHAQAVAAAQARAEAEQRAGAEDDRAKASERLARESDKAARGPTGRLHPQTRKLPKQWLVTQAIQARHTFQTTAAKTNGIRLLYMLKPRGMFLVALTWTLRPVRWLTARCEPTGYSPRKMTAWRRNGL